MDEVMLLIIGQMRDIDLSSLGNIDGEGREYCKAPFVRKYDCAEVWALQLSSVALITATLRDGSIPPIF